MSEARALRALSLMLALQPVGLHSPLGGQERAEARVPPVFVTLAGEWHGTGVLLGRPAEFSMRWRLSSAGFVRLAFTNAWVGEDGSRTPVLSSEATYYYGGSPVVGVWVDDRPQRLTIEAVVSDSTVVARWTAEAERGRTEYTVRAEDSVVVRDYVYSEGSERLFAEATYRRSRDPDRPEPSR